VPVRIKHRPRPLRNPDGHRDSARQAALVVADDLVGRPGVANWPRCGAARARRQFFGRGATAAAFLAVEPLTKRFMNSFRKAFISKLRAGARDGPLLPT